MLALDLQVQPQSAQHDSLFTALLMVSFITIPSIPMTNHLPAPAAEMPTLTHTPRIQPFLGSLSPEA